MAATKRPFGKSRLPIVLVVGLLIVIESSRRIECEDDDVHEGESWTGLFKQPPRLTPGPKPQASPLEMALGEPWGGFGVALGSHEGGFGVALGSQWVA
jgi:hypothetical protein